jgi:hypothetical protein
VEEEMTIEMEDTVERPSQRSQDATKGKSKLATTKRSTKAPASELDSEAPVSEADAPSPKPRTKSTSSRTRRDTVKPADSAPAQTDETDAAVDSEIDVDVIESESAPLARSTTSKPSRSKKEPKTTVKAKTASKKAARDSPQSESEPAAEPATQLLPPAKKTSQPKAAKATKATSAPSRLTSAAEQPVLTQLDRFGNIPPSSPFPGASQSKAVDSEITPRAIRPLGSAKNARASPQPIPAPAPAPVTVPSVVDAIRTDVDLTITEEDLKKPLTVEQKKMTAKQLMMLEFERQVALMRRVGEERISAFDERARSDRKRIERLPQI